MPPTGFLTVDEVATHLEMTPSGVYKLIKRGDLKAIRRSTRGIRIPAPALAAYQRRVNGETVTIERPAPQQLSVDQLRARFEDHTEHTVSEWLQAWKRDEIPDTPENMRCTMAALALANWDHTPDAQRTVVHDLV